MPYDVDGVVEIHKLDVDLSRGLIKLPENFTDLSDRIVTGCAADQGNAFVITR